MMDNKDIMENESEDFLASNDALENQEEFEHFSKAELVNFIEKFDWKDNLSKSSIIITNIKAAYDHQFAMAKNDALQKFVGDGGEEKDFEYRKDKEDSKFDKLYQHVKNEVTHHYAELEKNKAENFKIKTILLDRLRKLISAEESSLSLTEFKSIQDEWKKTGHVPVQYSQELWSNYKALVDMFYNNRSIFFELKELDRKKNLEAKIEVCEKVEKLAELSSVNQALKELKSLHEDFKLIGPVPKDDQASLWTRLKEASDKIYDKRKEYLKNQKELQEQNLVAKKEVLNLIDSYAAFKTTRIDEWKNKTLEVQKQQEAWRKMGALPLEVSKELNAVFWDKCKQFYKNKNDFFKELDEKRGENLQRKVELCEKIESLKASTDVESSIREVKELQRVWEKLGQVPIKQKDKIQNRFKEACDSIFNKKKEQLAETEKAFVVNFENKKALLGEIEQYISSDNPKTVVKLSEFQSQWDALGYVPREHKREMAELYNKTVTRYIEVSKEIGEEAKKDIRLSIEVMSLKSSDEGFEQLKKKEITIKKKLASIKSELVQYKTNIEFFGRSKGAEKLKEEIQANIDKLEIEEKTLQQELKIIKS